MQFKKRGEDFVLVTVFALVCLATNCWAADDFRIGMLDYSLVSSSNRRFASGLEQNEYSFERRLVFNSSGMDSNRIRIWSNNSTINVALRARQLKEDLLRFGDFPVRLNDNGELKVDIEALIMEVTILHAIDMEDVIEAVVDEATMAALVEVVNHAYKQELRSASALKNFLLACEDLHDIRDISQFVDNVLTQIPDIPQLIKSSLFIYQIESSPWALDDPCDNVVSSFADGQIKDALVDSIWDPICRGTHPLVERFRDSATCKLMPNYSPADGKVYVYGQYCALKSYDFFDALDYTTGPGTQTTSTEPPTAGLPDFVTTGLKLTDSDEDEHYTFNTTDTLYMHSYSKNIGDADWAGDSDDIYVKSYLSSGYKEDAHSDWQCVGTQQIQKGNLDVGDTKHEWDSFSLSGLAPGIYNIVTCTDRKYDQDNGDGEVPEKHKSNNCTTEAVFIVKEANLRVSADFGKKIFRFGEQRTLSSFTINEGGDVPSDIKLRWYLSEGKIFNNPTLLGEDNIQEEHLQAGAEKLEDILFTAPTKRGNYTLSVHTDSASSFPEANEDDNWQHFVIRVDDFAWLPAVMDILNN